MKAIFGVTFRFVLIFKMPFKSNVMLLSLKNVVFKGVVMQTVAIFRGIYY